jgi:hypothetical protein
MVLIIWLLIFSLHFSDIQKVVAHLKKHSFSTVDFIPIEGTHHFHMLKVF